MKTIPNRQAEIDKIMREHMGVGLKEPNCKNLTDAPAIRTVASNGDTYAKLLAAAERYVANAEPKITGDRDNGAFRLAGHILAFVNENGETLHHEDALRLMRDWNARNPEPLTDTEIVDKVNSAGRNGTPREAKIVGNDMRGTSRRSASSDVPKMADAPDDTPPVEVVAFGTLRQQNPKLNPPVIEGLLRRGETCNIIASPKVGKSWLAYDLALSIITGQWWLTEFQCHAGPVLLIDNELHPPTIAHRIPKVAEAKHIEATEYADKLDVLSLRGLGVSIASLQPYIGRIEAGHYSAIIADAWYRFIPPGMNENSNADVMSLYNQLDHYAAQTRAAWVVIHHSSKGNQGEKSVTDVGAGAGAQSRAADSHLVLRPHEEPGCIVLEAAVRSFAPVDPVGLRWEFPTWQRAHDLDTQALKGRKSQSEEKQDKRDAEGLDAITKALQTGPLTARAIRNHTGLSRDRAERLIGKLYADGQLIANDVEVRGNKTREYQLSQHDEKGVVGESSTTYPTT
ncbi:AAA family ATPase [Phycisphaerales bacterium AB-hyl4]|uniref:AAA family ATPase n=1 Tax=Natronomicrosphaera hydrolytica TaxID=3242702 RepID=A0ABV4U0P0_9BACT